MPGIDYRQLRADITMAEVLELLGFVVVERRGHQVRGQCPFHEPCTRQTPLFLGEPASSPVSVLQMPGGGQSA